MEDQVKKLIEKAVEAKGPGEAMNYTQAALNAANAMRALNDIEVSKKAH